MKGIRGSVVGVALWLDANDEDSLIEWMTLVVDDAIIVQK